MERHSLKIVPDIKLAYMKHFKGLNGLKFRLYIECVKMDFRKLKEEDKCLPQSP